uniref:Reverse transcriptase n=1 Tax=Peronospora matthiolae TaxID=2874970 RepID=A0AAV1UT41_9STRA
MSDFFRAFNHIAGQKQRATMACQTQANGTAARMLQTLTRALKMYVTDTDQMDWDEYAERLTFAIPMEQDRIRGDTPFYLIHGWDPRSTLEANLALGSTKRRDQDPRRWRYRMKRHYQRAREAVRIVYGLRSEIGPINTTLRTDHMGSKLDRKCGSIWIE